VAGLVPGGAAALDQQILGFEGDAGESIGQVGKPQVQGRDLRQSQVVSAERRGDGGETRHDRHRGGLTAVSLSEQAVKIRLLAHDICAAAPLDQRRPAERQALFGATEPEVPIPARAQAPQVMAGGSHPLSLATGMPVLYLVCSQKSRVTASRPPARRR